MRPAQPQPRASLKANIDGPGDPSGGAAPMGVDGTGSKGKKRSSEEAMLDLEDYVETVVDPKVMVPFDSKVGETPRRVQIERMKRLYAQQNLIDLLTKEGLVPDRLDLTTADGKVPLHYFDNVDYETRHPSQWVDKNIKVPAEAAFVNFEGKCIWKTCTVLDYVVDKNTYLVQWDDTGQESWLPRIQVHFKAEDPVLFARRFADAYKLRSKTESYLKYILYVESMPLEDIPPLTDEQEIRMEMMTFNNKMFREKNCSVVELLKEVNLDYARAMNKIVFDDSLHQEPTASREFVVSVDLDIPEAPKPAVPLCGCKPCPEYDFEETSSEFFFASCLTRPEVIIATGKLRFECNKVLRMILLSTHYNKSLRLEEFEQLQAQTSEQASQHLRET